MLKQLQLQNLIATGRLSLRTEVENSGDFGDLVASVKNFGILEPIIVRPTRTEEEYEKDPTYEIICGHKRYAACKRLNLDTIPSIILELDDKRAIEVALAENIQRENLDPIEEAEAFKMYAVNFGRGSVTTLAKRIGKSAEYVSHRLLLLGLPKPIVKSIKRGRLKASSATELVWIDDPEKQLQLSNEIIENDMSFRETRMAVRWIRQENKTAHEAARFALASRSGSSDTPISFSEERSSWVEYRGDGDSNSEDLKLLNHAVLIMRSCLSGLDMLVDKAQSSETREVITKQRESVHMSLDSIIQAKMRQVKGIELKSEIRTKL